jgi:outer membrane lipoprotein-sorting protein
MDVIKMNRENIEEILKQLGSEDVPSDVQKIAEETARDFSETQTRQPKHYILWENIMRSRITRLAAAAAIVIAVVFGVWFFVGGSTSVALADVLAKVEQAKAFMYKMKVNTFGSMMTGKPGDVTEMDYTITISQDYGWKWETQTTIPNTGKTMTQIMYLLPKQKKGIMIMPEMKKYMQMEFDDELATRAKKQNNDPREMIKQIMGCQYTELGRSVIDGKEVEGFQTTDLAMLAGIGENIKCTLWVDAKSWLPVRAEMDFKMGEQMQANTVIYDYQWDIPVSESDFEPTIPDDYTPISEEAIKMPSMSEEAAIEGFRFFVEQSGRYPKKLDMISVMQELVAIQKTKEKTDTGPKSRIDPNQGGLENIMKETMEIMRPVQSLTMFYMRLVQDKKEPVYYGESVTPADTDKVLLRWKTSDNEYRIIFGDLHTETVSADELAELEANLPK